MGLLRSIAALFSRSSRRTSASDPRHALGRRGEQLAARFLRQQGYKILRENYRAPGGGEVDLVARDRTAHELVFIEVKTRTSAEFGRPAEAVGPAKQELIARGARSWLRLLGRCDVVFRFDIVEVVLTKPQPTLTHLRSAFVLPEERRTP